MKSLRLLIVTAILGGIAVGVGFLAAGAVILTMAWAFPFRPEWDDTWHEFLPVGLAYLTWLVVSLAVFILGIRLVRRRLGGPHR